MEGGGSFGLRLKELRRALDLTQEELAGRLRADYDQEDRDRDSASLTAGRRAAGRRAGGSARRPRRLRSPGPQRAACSEHTETASNTIVHVRYERERRFQWPDDQGLRAARTYRRGRIWRCLPRPATGCRAL